MMKNLKLTKRKKLLGAVIICVALITCSTILWQMGQVAEAAILDPHPGLVGWWRFDEEDGTLAEDSSGYGNDGTVYGATLVDGKYGKALSFDGTDDYVEMPRGNIDGFNKLTLELWIKRDIYSAQGGLLGDNGGGWASRCFTLAEHGSESDTIVAHFASGDSGEVHRLVTISNDVWTHIAVTFKANNRVNVYKNGLKVYDEPTYLGTLNDVTNILYIGRYIGYYFQGTIDEVRIYNRALSAAEIETLSQKGPDFSSRLLAKVPKGTTEFMVTLSWQGVGGINVTIESLVKNYTEDVVPVYQRTDYSSSSGDILNIKRLSVPITALLSDEDWYIVLEFDDVEDYRITVEVQR